MVDSDGSSGGSELLFSLHETVTIETAKKKDINFVVVIFIGYVLIDIHCF
tara:strand:- start:56174 stop:56323 length:150 start_codon:yes stop_codon:yes gene_type:complete